MSSDIEGLYTTVESHFDKRHHVAHGVQHALRVARLARHIAGAESYDPLEAEIAGLLHDMGRAVQEEEKGHGPAGVPLARSLLRQFTGFGSTAENRILSAVHDHSQLRTEGILTHIVQDADMLDGLGAIGLERAFTSKAHLLEYDPSCIIPIQGARDTTIHEQIAFQMEWRDMMHTPTGRQIADERYDFMATFLEQVQREVLGQDLK